MKSARTTALLCLSLLLAILTPRPASAAPNSIRLDWWIVTKGALKGAVGAGAGEMSGGTPLALCGGAAATLSIMYSRPPQPDPKVKVPDNPNNPLDVIGKTQNRIVRDYVKSHNGYNLNTFYQWLQTNKSRYNINVSEMPTIAQIAAAVKATHGHNVAIDQLVHTIHQQFDKQKIKQPEIMKQLNKIVQPASKGHMTATQLNDALLQLENQSLADTTLNKQQTQYLQVMWSVLRHGVGLWAGET